MHSIVSYQKASDVYTVYTLNTPENSTELCTISGLTYVAIPAEALPEQPEQIAASVARPELTVELLAAISATSPHVALIRERVVAMIAERYSVTDEVKLLRTAPSAEFEVYNAYAEDCRQWGRDQKALLGL